MAQRCRKRNRSKFSLSVVTYPPRRFPGSGLALALASPAPLLPPVVFIFPPPNRALLPDKSAPQHINTLRQRTGKASRRVSEINFWDNFDVHPYPPLPAPRFIPRLAIKIG